MRRPKAMFAAGSESLFRDLFDGPTLSRLHDVVDLHPSPLTAHDEVPSSLSNGVEVLITGWGAPRFDHAQLAKWQDLRVVVHAAGSVKRLVTPELWERGIRVSSSAQANAQPVAEYTLAMILLGAKRTLESAHDYRETRSFRPALPHGNFGAFGITVGVIGASRIGRRVIELLQPFDIRVLLYDPMLSDAESLAIPAERVGLDELFSRSDVVTVHAPLLPETRNMVGARQLALLRDDAVVINTARGPLVDTGALVAELSRGRLRAILDVTSPEPLDPAHPLFSLPGVTLTPHVAGSLGNELQRLGMCAVEEIERYVATGELVGEVTSPDLMKIA